MFLFLIPQKNDGRVPVSSPPLKAPRWGLNLSPLLIIDLLHFRLKLFLLHKCLFRTGKSSTKVITATLYLPVRA